MNTEITYMYRDASNNKQFHTVILVGEISSDEIAIIENKLVDGVYFIPEQVGLESLQARWPRLDDEDDHVYHELIRDDIKLTEESPTDALITQELVRGFLQVKWDVDRAYSRLWSLDEW